MFDKDEKEEVRQISFSLLGNYLIERKCPRCSDIEIMVKISSPLGNPKRQNRFRCMGCLEAFVQEVNLKELSEKELRGD